MPRHTLFSFQLEPASAYHGKFFTWCIIIVQISSNFESLYKVSLALACLPQYAEVKF